MYNVLTLNKIAAVGTSCLGDNYAGYTQTAIDSVFPGFGSVFVSIAMIFFVYTTIMAYYFYSESSLMYLMRRQSGSRTEKVLVTLLRLAIMAMAVLGTVYQAQTVWNLGDIGVGLQAWINVIVLILLSREGFRMLREFEKKG